MMLKSGMPNKKSTTEYIPYDVEFKNGKIEYYRSKQNTRFGYAFKTSLEVRLFDILCELLKGDEKKAMKLLSIIYKLAGIADE